MLGQRLHFYNNLLMLLMFIFINICPRYICSVYKKLPKWPYHYILHEQWMRVPVGPHPYQHWEFIASFLNFNHLGNVELYFMMILICFSLMTSDSNKIFLCLLANDVSFFVNHRFKSLPITTKKRGGAVFLLLS